MAARIVCLLLAVILVTVAPLEAADKKGFPVSIIHINDLHARFEATDTSGGTCDEGEECIGGYPRTVHTVRRLLREQAELNPIYINAGDSFQGTLWYNIGRWNVTQQLLNLLPADAMTLGNHEFDHGVEGVVPFLETVDTNMLVANMDCAHEPTMEGKYNKSMIIERSGRKIGLIGVILETTYDLANTGKVIFRNESDTIREEAQLLKAQGANIIIVVSHCGYDVDKEIAANAGDWIDVIVGSHSHTFLYTGTPPGPHRPVGDYPTEVVHSSGHRVLIVQASAYARYVGNLVVYFDDNGDVLDFEGDPLYMDQSVPEDEDVLQAMVPWQDVMEPLANRIVGQSRVFLEQSSCNRGECNLGNFFTDAILHEFVKDASYIEDNWSNVTVALTSPGTFRVPIPAGNITYKQLFAMCPWQNRLIALTLRGKHILELLENGVASMNPSSPSPWSSRFMQVSGLRIVFDLRASVGQRVSSVRVRCSKCQVPAYRPLDLEEKYRVVVMDYLASGKNGFSVISDNAEDLERGPFDLDALMDYMSAVGPITTGIEHRIQFVNT
ncbi:apyrase isoform X1 [Drosophila gunungcola]|uniref:apyrase isoform X1 n=1 Tax=Drosophila gunungcola TaxID=103775 RepID=UPI0022DFA162|nr:apyrase isoform X1 [Drosophila gunungcola]